MTESTPAITESIAKEFVPVLQSSEQPYGAGIESKASDTLKASFSFLESPRNELSGLLSRSDSYAVKLIEAVESPNISTGDPQVIASIATGEDLQSPLKNEQNQVVLGHESFDNKGSLLEIFKSATEKERDLIVLNMVMKCLTAPQGNTESPIPPRGRVQELVKLLQTIELASTNPSTHQIDLPMTKSLESAGRIIGTISSRASLESDYKNKTQPFIKEVSEFLSVDLRPAVNSDFAQNAANLMGKAI